MKKSVKNNKGITLIALVITIIVLLILAGVRVATLTGDSGILTQADKAKTETEKVSAKEQVEVIVLRSFNSYGELDYKRLSKNLAKINKISGIPDEITDSSFPIIVTVDGTEISISSDGTATIK